MNDATQEAIDRAICVSEQVRTGTPATRREVAILADGLNAIFERTAELWAQRFAVPGRVTIAVREDGSKHLTLEFRRREKGWAFLIDTWTNGPRAIASTPFENASLRLRILAASNLAAIETKLEASETTQALELAGAFEGARAPLSRSTKSGGAA
ncbi:MAG: hypothetical protein ACRBN8_19885 [Nannocystales bacterium]